jgi:hypothetical protein
MITPLNSHLHIKPIPKDSIIATHENNFDEKGLVVGVPEFPGKVNVNDIVYFDSWTAARYVDSNGEEFWLVPYNAIRAKEDV